MTQDLWLIIDIIHKGHNARCIDYNRQHPHGRQENQYNLINTIKVREGENEKFKTMEFLLFRCFNQTAAQKMCILFMFLENYYVCHIIVSTPTSIVFVQIYHIIVLFFYHWCLLSTKYMYIN